VIVRFVRKNVLLRAFYENPKKYLDRVSKATHMGVNLNVCE